MNTSTIPSALVLSLLCGTAVGLPGEHQELDVALHAPFDAGAGGQRTFVLHASHPGLDAPDILTWRMALVRPDGRTVLRWAGQQAFDGAAVTLAQPWSGRIGSAPAPAGMYRVEMQAWLRGQPRQVIEQDWEIRVGAPRLPLMPAFAPLARAGDSAMVAAPDALPYTVYLGNLHSQTNHSDGGAALDQCKGAQSPLQAPHGPDAAFAYARAHGLDFLLASEHNHMFDGSEGSAPGADPQVAKARYRSGLDIAAGFSSADPRFLALYGLEWGVINNGGHLNILNSDELLGWETNARGELIADTATPRGDYAALYTLMRQRGWIGQFNHPATSGQFMVAGVPLAFTEDGHEVMVLCEVMNTNAFSTNVSESETRRSHFEGACNRLLEAGYRIALSTNQDNHCANWGAAYSNRTGVLLAAGERLSRASFIEALRARRVFATMNKESQLVLTANGHMMGERFSNRGPLTLSVSFANQRGRQVASVAIMAGQPGSSGSVKRLSQLAQTTLTPEPGAHFYYAKLTQDDGKVLWSAPVWVIQQP